MLRLLPALLLLSAAHAEKPRTHDGFHLAFGLAPTYAAHFSSFESADEEYQGRVEGVGIGGMLMAGQTVAEGLVIGGSLLTGGHAFSPSGTLKNVDQDTSEDLEADGDLVFNLVGPYLNYYADEREGLHGLLVIGFATLEDGDDDTDGLALGWGFVLGAGYDWWVADQWSLGVLARMHVLFTSHELEVAGETLDVDYFTVAPGLMLTAAYH